MATFTANYGFLKPAGSENVNVVTQLADNLDDIDTQIKNRQNEVDVIDARVDALEAMVPVEAIKSGDTTINSTTFTDIANMSHSIEVGGTTEIYLVWVTLNVEFTVHSSGVAFIAKPHVAGSIYGSSEIVWAASGTGLDEHRATLSKLFLVVGISAGTHTFKVQARLNGSSQTAVVYGTHSTLVVQRLR